MKVLGCVVAGVLLFGSTTFAAPKIEVGANVGYGFGAGASQNGASYEQDLAGNNTNYTDLYTSGGNGIKILVDGSLFFNDNLGVVLLAGCSFLGGYEQKTVRPVTQGFPLQTVLITSDTKTHTEYVPINVGMKLKTKIDKFSPYVYVAPGIYFCFANSDNTTTGQVNSSTSYQLSPGFGFIAGLGTTYALTDKLGIKAEITPNYAFANVQQSTWTRGDQKITTIYENNTPTLPDNTITGNDQKYYYHGQPRWSFSSIAINVGAYFDF